MKLFAVIGLGRFGSAVAMKLSEKGQQVLAIDKNEELVQDIMDNVTKAVCLDATDERAVRAIGLKDADVAICGIGTDIEASILVTLLLKDLGIPEILCKGTSLAHKKVLEKIGATKVVLPEKDTAEHVADMLVTSSNMVLDQIGLSGNSSIIELIAPEEFVGKNLRHLDLRERYGVNIIAVKKKNHVNITPHADDVISEGDVLVIFGENEKLGPLKRMTG